MQPVWFHPLWHILHTWLSLSLRECIQNKVETREHTHTSMHARKQLPFFGSHTHAETQPLSLSPPLSGNQRECHNRSHAPSPPPRRLTINTGMDMNMLSCSDFPPSRFAPSLIPNIPSLSLSVAIKCFSYDLALCSRTTGPPFSAHTHTFRINVHSWIYLMFLQMSYKTDTNANPKGIEWVIAIAGW